MLVVLLSAGVWAQGGALLFRGDLQIQAHWLRKCPFILLQTIWKRERDLGGGQIRKRKGVHDQVSGTLGCNTHPSTTAHFHQGSQDPRPPPSLPLNSLVTISR